MKITTFVFDLGSVLIDWKPTYLYDKMFADKEKEKYFLHHICTLAWHEKQNAGCPPQRATEEMVQQYPEWEPYIRAYYGRWKEMFRGGIEGTLQIVKELKDKGYKLYISSNWNAELYNCNAGDFPFLQWFDGKLLSGEIKMMKPDKEIYQFFLETFRINPEQALFIDNNQENCDAAQALDFHTICFVNPVTLRQQLEELKIL